MVNLTIAFDRHEFRNSPILCHDRMRLDIERTEVFEKIQAAANPLPDGVRWYEDGGLKDRMTDPYDDPITFVPAGTLARILSEFDLSDLDAAALAYLKALQPHIRIVLWWS